MLKKTITYKDYSGLERKEDFYFNLSKSEITEMELSIEGGLQNKMERLISEQNGGEIIRVIKDIILRSYGQKSEDGRRFIKGEEISKAFSETPAYDQLFMSLVTDAEEAANFIKGIVPEDLSGK